MTLKTLFDVTVGPLKKARVCDDVVLVLATEEAEARAIVEESKRFGQIKFVLPEAGQIAANGPSRIIGRLQNVSI